jgi:uncharacterized protein YdgA (DUF945 family)
MRLKRIVLTCLVLLLVAALALPWWIGRDTEARYRALVAAASDGPTPFRLRLEEFERGWFTSEARVTVRAATPRAGALLDALGPGNGNLVLIDRIAHGPLPVPGSKSGLAWRPALAAVDGRLRQPGPEDRATLGRFSYRIGFDGGATLTFAAPGGGTADGSPGRVLDWRDLGFEASVPARYGPVTLSMTAAELAVGQPQGRLVLEDLAWKLDGVLPGEGLPEATSELSARSATLETANGERQLGSASELLLRGAFEARDDQAHGNLEGRLQRMGSPRESYGPGRFRLAVGDLDAKSLSRLLQSLSRIKARGLQGRAGAMAMAGALLAETPSLLAHGPALELENLELETPDGPLTARGRLDLASTKPVVLRNPYLLQRAVRGEFALDVPAAAARHAALIHLRRNGLLDEQSPKSWLAEQVSRGRLTRRDGDFHASIRLAKGRVSVNGHPWAELWH